VNDSILLSIKEFSALTGTNQSTLRYYDEIGLLPPSKRAENNYRLYSPVQIQTLNFISVLAELGVPLSTIKELSEHRTPEHVLQLLAQQEKMLDDQLRKIRTNYSIIHIFRDNIQSGLWANENEFIVQEMPEQNFILGQENHYEENDEFHKPFIQFCKDSFRNRINLNFPIGGWHKNMSHFLKKASQPMRFFSLDPYGNDKRKSGKYLVGYYRAYYGVFNDFPQRMKNYADEHKLLFKGPVYVKYLLDEISIAKEDEYLAQVSVEVINRK